MSEADPETVYRVPGHNTIGVLHADPDCHYLVRSRVHEKPREVFPDDYPVCEACWPDEEGGLADA